MPKIRSIKPDFFIDSALSKLQPLTRLAFIGLWCYADREGRLEDEPEKLKVEILPYDSIDMDKVLNELSPKFIARYESGGKRFIQIINFLKHQRPHPHETPSTIVKCNDMTLHAISCREIMLDKDGVDTYGVDTYELAAKPQKSNNFNIFMDRVLKELFKLVPNGEPSSRAAVSAAYRRYGRAGKDILAFADGDPEVAFKGVRAVGLWLQGEGLTWTLDTAAKHFLDWKADPGGFHAKCRKK